jgi:hypothetical protein
MARKPYLRWDHFSGGRPLAKDGGLSVVTPEAWRNPMELRDRWEGLKPDRNLPATEAASNLLGVGHALFDRALASAISRPMHLTRAIGLKRPLVLFQIIDEVTGMQARVHEVIMGYGAQDGTEPATDGELLHLLNTLKPKEGLLPVV